MKKVCFVLVLIITVVMLCSCGGYVKSYSATILITSCQGNEASMEFDTFKGTNNFKLRRDVLLSIHLILKQVLPKAR